MDRAVVAIAKCREYEQEKVSQAVHETIERLGGMSSVVRPGQRVLIKVNLLLPVAPEKAVTTHPTVVRAVVEEVKKAGGIPSLCESSGLYGMTNRAAEASGIMAVARETGIEFLNLEKGPVEPVRLDRARLDWALPVAKAVLDCDVLINLPKLKVHRELLYTGAVKNLFGAVPGGAKSELHIKTRSLEKLAEALVDLCMILKPALSLIDGIVGMEGEGPTNGTPVRSGLILASKDPVAVDSVASFFIGIEDPGEVGTNRIGQAWGLGVMDLDRIQVVGFDSWKEERVPFQVHSLSAFFSRNLPSFMQPFIFKRLQGATRIKFLHEKCVRCGNCAKACPAQVIVLSPKPSIQKKGCIKCTCCQELCPHGAVAVEMSWLGRVVSNNMTKSASASTREPES